MKKKTRKYSLYLAIDGAKIEEVFSAQFLQKIKNGDVQKLRARHPADGSFDGYFLKSFPKTPTWIELLDETFEMPNFTRRSPASLVAFEVKGRLFIATFGYGAKLLNEAKLERTFGIRAIVNKVNDGDLRSVEKANIASALQQFSQASFKSKFGSFGGQNKFEILKRIAGSTTSDDVSALVGSAGLTITTQVSFSEIVNLAESTLDWFHSNAYQSTPFAVIDEFLPVTGATEIMRLNELLLADLKGDSPGFELSVPQMNFDDNGYIKLTGKGIRGEFVDVSLQMYCEAVGASWPNLGLDDLESDRVRLFNDEHTLLGNWTVHRCLVGALQEQDTRYVLHEGDWYIPAIGIVGVVENYFSDRKLDPDPELETFDTVAWKKQVGKTGKTRDVRVYETEEVYNERIARESGYVLFDQKWHKAEDGSFSQLEVCDLFDPVNLRMIHVKRTSRRTNMLSYLFEQGLRAAQLWQRDDVRTQFIGRVNQLAGEDAAKRLQSAKSDEITMEFAIADYPNNKGEFTIPFLAKLAFENCAREIELRAFRTGLRFVPLDRPEKLTDSQHQRTH